MNSRVFGSRAPKKPHLVQGGGLADEVRDLRDDIEASFIQLQEEARGDTAARTALGGTLGADNAGHTFYDTDLAQLFTWDGADWQVTGLPASVDNATATNQNASTGVTVDSATATNQSATTGVTVDSTTATNTATKFVGHVRYSHVVTADLVTVVADVAMADGAQIVADQPDYPRKLAVGITDSDSSVSAGTLDIVGVGPGGEAVTESVDLTGGSSVKTTVNAYATVTSLTVANLADATGADKVSVGLAASLGLPIPALAGSVAVFKADVDGWNEAVGTVDATARTISPTTAPDSTHDYDFWYSYTVAPAQNSHTHSVTDTGHTHTQNSHNHAVTDGGHTHTQNAHTHALS